MFRFTIASLLLVAVASATPVKDAPAVAVPANKAEKPSELIFAMIFTSGNETATIALDLNALKNHTHKDNGARFKRDDKANLKGCAAGAGAFAATNGLATAVAPNPITGITAAISALIATVCQIVESNT